MRKLAILLSAERPLHDETTRGVVDTNILILRARIDPSELPQEIAISAVTLAELAAGVHLVRGDTPYDIAERARRVDILQRVEREFDPLPFDAATARFFGRLSAAVLAIGRTPRRRIADLMIAATAASRDLFLYTTNPDDYLGLSDVVTVVPIKRPPDQPYPSERRHAGR
ncbi:MAG: type II toxin-antitoxin system VapC family toxin [Propionibacteriaceae bacterium]|jgi:predicted nucleic acid-binding protein|nr:type II toxin-antitoxin system VapC family toxin [Propionibacteriaceae bacterium]